MYQQVSQLVSEELQFLEEELNRYLASQNPLISQISRHICESGGKRIRPLLVLLCSRLCGYPGEDVVVYASVVEFVHTATLLHDDVIDEATTRRGVPSANARWGNSIPVLVGDYLFSVSNALLVEKKQPRILEVMANTVKSIVDGELWEIFKRRDFGTTEEDYFSIITKKTAALFAFCCQIGAILGEKGNSHEQALANFGLNLGIAFQLVDDLLDLTSHPQKLGKPVGNDLREGNLTLPLIHLIKRANPGEVKRIQQIVQNVNGGSADVDYIHQLLDRYDSSCYVLQIASQYIQQAKENLSIFDGSAFHQALLSLSDYVVRRES
jgi:octaprenyl-diphosphate synthase